MILPFALPVERKLRRLKLRRLIGKCRNMGGRGYRESVQCQRLMRTLAGSRGPEGWRGLILPNVRCLAVRGVSHRGHGHPGMPDTLEPSVANWILSRANIGAAGRPKKSTRAGFPSMYGPEESIFPDHPYCQASRRSKRADHLADRSKRFHISRRRCARHLAMTRRMPVGL